MHVIADFCVIPIGVGTSVSRYVAICQDVLEESGLDHTMHAYGTNVEGEWDDVFRAIRLCHDRIHEAGAPRVSTSVRIGTRIDREQSMEDKIESVLQKRSK
jgi:uncharacterized protein (TIGR00106 family)